MQLPFILLDLYGAGFSGVSVRKCSRLCVTWPNWESWDI